MFAEPAVLEKAVAATQGLVPIGRTDEVRERFHAISVERRLEHPAVAAIADAARARAQRAAARP